MIMTTNNSLGSSDLFQLPEWGDKLRDDIYLTGKNREITNIQVLITFHTKADELFRFSIKRSVMSGMRPVRARRKARVMFSNHLQYRYLNSLVS